MPGTFPAQPDPLPIEDTWDMPIADTIETVPPEGTIQWQDMGGLSRALAAMAEVRDEVYFALHLDGTWGVYEDYPPFRYGDRIYQMEYLAGAGRWDITRYDRVEKTINGSGREVPLVLNLWAQRDFSFYLLDNGPFLQLNLPRPDSLLPVGNGDNIDLTRQVVLVIPQGPMMVGLDEATMAQVEEGALSQHPLDDQGGVYYVTSQNGREVYLLPRDSRMFLDYEYYVRRGHFEQEPPPLNPGPVTSEGPGAARNPAKFANVVLDHNSPGALRHEFPAGRQVYVYDEREQTSMVEVRGWATDPDHPGRGRVQTNIPGQLLNPTLPSEWNHGPARYALWDPDQLRAWQERAKEEITSGTIILIPPPPSKALLATEFPEGRKMYVEFFGKRVLAEVWSINDDGTIHMGIVPNRPGDTMETGDFTPEDLWLWNPPDPTEVRK